MSSPNYEDSIQFRAGAEKTAAEVLDAVHVGGINVSELAREGLVEMLRRVVTDEDKIAIYEQYTAGEVDEEVARLLLGDDLDAIREERADFRVAMDVDTEGMFQE